jgi:hypothetical protein
VEQLQISHTATGSSYNTLDALHDALIQLEHYHGISYGTKHSSETKCFGGKFKGTQQGLVSAVSDTEKMIVLLLLPFIRMLGLVQLN